MRYLGSFTRSGTLWTGDAGATAASFEFECYLLKQGVLASSGELESTEEALQRMHGVNGVDFLTSDGHLLKLTLSDRKKAPEGGSAHVVAAGDLPVYKNGALDWPAVDRQVA